MSTNRPQGNAEHDYRDPLENYDPKQYAGPLERALATGSVSAIESRPFVTVPPTITVEEAMTKLVDLSIACLLVSENDRLVGIFTERDALNKVALEYEQLKHRPVAEFMTSNPVFVYSTDSPAAALAVMAAAGFRHVPVIDLNNCITGVISPQRVTAFLENYLHD